jgi:hypothetical protein
VHQLNCTYYSALACDDDRYLAARAIQLFARGIPQIYYVGLLAGENDHAAVGRTGEGRAINRHDFPRQEVDDALGRDVVRRLIDLIRLRNTHRAFDGRSVVEVDGERSITLRWELGTEALALKVDFGKGRAKVVDAGRSTTIASWEP